MASANGQLSQLIIEKANLTPSLAHSLASHFGMSPDFWLNLQAFWDLYHKQWQETKGV